MISHIENKMPENGYRSDDHGNTGCLRCISKVLEILHSGDAVVSHVIAGHVTYDACNFKFIFYSTSTLVMLR